MDLNETALKIYRSTVPLKYNVGYTVGNSSKNSDFEMNFSSSRSSSFKYNENILIEIDPHYDGKNVDLIIKEKNGRFKIFDVNQVTITVPTKSFNGVFAKLLKGYVELGQKTIDFYNQF